MGRGHQGDCALRLHLGCGRKKLDGYINIDLSHSDFDCDIRLLPEYFASDSVEEILAVHVVEHFYITEVLAILQGWYQVLHTDGRLVIELPCWDKVKGHIKADATENMTRWALYGDPLTHKDGEPALHKWCYSKDEMRKLLTTVGFSSIYSESPKYHVKDRDMRWIATK